MNANDLIESKYLKAEKMDRPLTLTIDGLRREKMSDGEEKWVMYFREVTLGLVLNVVNITSLKEFFGDETDDWDHQRVTLVREMVMFGTKKVPGIRLRLPGTRPARSSKPAPPVTQAEADMPDDGWEPGRE